MEPAVPPDELAAPELLVAIEEELTAVELELTTTLELDAFDEELVTRELELATVLELTTTLELTATLELEAFEDELTGAIFELDAALEGTSVLEEEVALEFVVVLLDVSLELLKTAAEVHALPHLAVQFATESGLLTLPSQLNVFVPKVVSDPRFTAVPLPQDPKISATHAPKPVV